MEKDYDMLFNATKNMSIHKQAISSIREVAEDKNKSDMQRFVEIQKIVESAIKYLKD